MRSTKVCLYSSRTMQSRFYLLLQQVYSYLHIFPNSESSPPHYFITSYQFLHITKISSIDLHIKILHKREKFFQKYQHSITVAIYVNLYCEMRMDKINNIPTVHFLALQVSSYSRQNPYIIQQGIIKDAGLGNEINLHNAKYLLGWVMQAW